MTANRPWDPSDFGHQDCATAEFTAAFDALIQIGNGDVDSAIALEGRHWCQRPAAYAGYRFRIARWVHA